MLKKNKSFVVFLIFALIFLAWGIFLVPGDELFYTLLAQYLILPVASLICSILSVKKGTALGWVSPLIFALITILLPFAVFGTTDIAFVIFAAVPAVIGFVIGGICVLAKKCKKSKKEITANA